MNRRSLKVFLCHASSDKPAVRNLYFKLRSAAVYIVPWLDKEDLLPGQRWKYEISLAVRSSDIVLVCISNTSIRKPGYVQKEIKDALDVADLQPEGTIFLIPVKLEECQIPDRLSDIHCVNLYEEDGFDRLMRSLTARAQQLGINVTTGVATEKEEPTYSPEERKETIKWVIADELEIDVSDLMPHTTLAEHKGDWVTGVEIKHRLKTEFGIKLSEADAEGMQIILDVLNAQYPGW
jgi:acyl carrier protein